MSIIIEEGGFLTTIQDAGRFGKQQFGVAVSGAMDLRSMRIANLLVGNDKDEATIEATMMGPVLKFEKENVFAITGADLSPRLNGEPIEGYRATKAKKGDIISFGTINSGYRAYIAFAGGLDIPDVMGSKSTFLWGSFGGYRGRSLQSNDRIEFRAPKDSLSNMEERYLVPETFSNKEITLRVICGPQQSAFTKKGYKTFFLNPYTITSEYSRVGAWLEGEAVEHTKDGNIISDGNAFGSIQVPSNGKPIIMLAERYTNGSFAKIATVISTDLPLLAQSKPGMKMHFEEINVYEARDAYMTEYIKLLDHAKKFNHTSK